MPLLDEAGMYILGSGTGKTYSIADCIVLNSCLGLPIWGAVHNLCESFMLSCLPPHQIELQPGAVSRPQWCV